MDWQTLGETTDGAAGASAFAIPPEVLRQHLYVLGRTGTGKSTFLARLALANIERGEGMVVLDPHGDLVTEIIDHCPQQAQGKIIYLDPADREYPVPVNLFESRPGQNKDTICSEVIGIFKRLYGELWGPLLEDLLRSLTLGMLDHQFLQDEAVPAGHRYNATLKEAYEFLFDPTFRKTYYPYLSNDMVLRYWRDFYDRLGYAKDTSAVSVQQIRYSSSTSNKLRRFLLNELIFDICCNRDRLNTIDLRQVMADRRILLINLSKGRIGEDQSALLGSVWLSRIAVAALARAETPAASRDERIFHVIADEFQSFMSETFKLLLSEARKYGIAITIAHQHREQLDHETRGATLNCGSLVCFRVTGRDADDVCREYDATPSRRRWRYEPYVGVSVSEPEIMPQNLLTADQRRAEITRIELELADVQREFRSAREASSDLETRRPSDADSPELQAARARERKLKRLLIELQKDLDRLERFPPLEDARLLTYVSNPGEHIRVPEEGSYAERTRQIANELTQLPNFRAMARFVTGKHSTFELLPLPPSTEKRAERIARCIEQTRNAYAVRPDERMSRREGAYFTELRRKEAEAYEAEPDEQPAFP